MKKIVDSFVAVIKDSNFQGVVKENFEVVFDNLFLKDGLVKDIAFLQTFVGLINTGKNIQDQLFLKKIIKFLIHSETTTSEERLKVIEEIDATKEHRIKVGEKLIYIIDKHDDYLKSGILGYLFKAVQERKLKYSDLLRCSLVLDKCLVNELDFFLKEHKEKYSVEFDSELLNWGLVEFAPLDISLNNDNLDSPQLEGANLNLKVSKAGELLRLHLNDYLEDCRLELGIVTMKLPEIKKHLKHLENYPVQRKLLLEKEAIIELCNNVEISDTDFNNIIKSIIKKRPFLSFTIDSTVNSHYNRQISKGNDFNLNRWKSFYNTTDLTALF